MSDFSVKVNGAERFEKAVGRLRGKRLRELSGGALKKNGRTLQRETAARSLSGQRVPIVSGRLHGSLERNDRNLPHSVFVGSNAPHAAPLEFGWPAKNIRPRAWLEFGLGLSQPKFPEAWLEAIDQALAAEGGRS